jgi:GDP-mannose 6-dehydrogenase
MKISIFGLGYIGTVSAACLAEHGHDIIGIDVNKSKLDFLSVGKSSIYEKDLQKSLHNNLSRISASSDVRAAILKTSISILCINTPNKKDGLLDISNLKNAIIEISNALVHKKNFHLILIRSTIPPGTCQDFISLIKKISKKTFLKDFDLVANPEFLREGSAIFDFFNPPYTIFGRMGTQRKTDVLLQKLYGRIKAPIYQVDIRSAELIKFINNSWHATKIAFANEIGTIATSYEVDLQDLLKIFFADTKLNISTHYLKPGFAYGGSCLVKDLRGLYSLAEKNESPSILLRSVEKSNGYYINFLTRKVLSYKVKNVLIIGVAFKEDTDDTRFSGAIKLAKGLLKNNIKIEVYDEVISRALKNKINHISIKKDMGGLINFLSDDINSAIKKSQLCIIINNQKSINNNLFKNKIILNFKNFELK